MPLCEEKPTVDPQEVFENEGQSVLLRMAREGKLDAVQVADLLSSHLETSGERLKHFVIVLTESIFK
jgi:hypothetical protein